MSDLLERLDPPSTARLVAYDGASSVELDWDALRDAASERARALGGLGAGRRVLGVSGTNGFETLLQTFSVLAAGGIPAPMPADTDPAVRARCLAALGAAGLWTDKDRWRALDGDRRQPAGFELAMHSSGSTGIPKALAIRLAAMRANAIMVAEALDLGPDDVHIGTFSHCYMSGLYNATILPIATGAKSIAVAQVTPLTVGPFVRAMREHRPTVLWLSPLVARLFVTLKGVPDDAFRRVRRAISCTAPLPLAVRQSFEARFGLPLLQSYGLCETLITTVEDPDRPGPGSVGRPVGPKGAVVLDAQGQIVIANGCHFAGYLDAAETRAELTPVEPYATGDLGRFDEAGNLYVLGRLSETINRDGIKFSPETVEAVMNDLPGVRDSALIGIDDPQVGTRLVAFVVAEAPDADRIRRALSEALPTVQRPHEIRHVAALPRTTSGKIDRTLLKREYAHGLH
jgi:acyl-coenzyme A synthetase/AMP-(fatty) acid ligase